VYRLTSGHQAGGGKRKCDYPGKPRIGWRHRAGAARRAGDYQILRGDWIGDYLDPATFLDIFRGDSGNNYTGWAHPEYDAALFAAARTADPVAREKLLQRAESILLENVPFIPVYHYTHVFLIHPAVKGWHANLLDHHPYKHVWLEP